MRNLSNQKKIIVLIAVMFGVLLSSLDITIVSTSMMGIVKDLNGFDLYALPFTAYLMTTAICMPLFGKFADKFGHKLIYILGIIVFVLGSSLCGMSQNMLQLIIFRGIQGIGGAILTANSLSIIGVVFEPKERSKYIALLGAAGAVASIVGPILGGYITDNYSWRWIFYINVPIGVIAIIAILIALPNEKPEQTSKKVDIWGAITFTVGLAPMLLVLTWGGNKYDRGSPQILTMLGSSVVLLILFAFIEKHASDPIIPLSLFKKSDFNISSIEMFLINAIVLAIMAFLPMFLQVVVGQTASHTGTLLIPIMASTIVSSIASGLLVSKIGKYKLQIIIGFAILTVSTILFAQMGVDTHKSTVMLYMLIAGVGIGITLPLFNTIAQNAFDESQMGVVTSGVQFFKTLGSTLSTAILGTILNTTIADKLAKINTGNLPDQVASSLKNTQVLSNLSALKAISSKLPKALLVDFQSAIIQMKQMFSDSLILIFTVCIGISFVTLVISFFIKEKPFRVSQEK